MDGVAEAPASAAVEGTVLLGGAVLLLTLAFVGLGLACLWMKPARANRALRVLEELRVLVNAIRGFIGVMAPRLANVQAPGERRLRRRRPLLSLTFRTSTGCGRW